MSLEETILAEGAKIRALAHRGALETRKSRLVEELETIEADLKGLAPAAEAPAEKTKVPKKQNS